MIETQFDNFESAEAANAFMTSEEFRTNPIGVDFDPEELIKKIENGESTEALAKRSDIGPRDITSVPFLAAAKAH